MGFVKEINYILVLHKNMIVFLKPEETFNVCNGAFTRYQPQEAPGQSSKGIEHYGYLEGGKWTHHRALGCRAAHPSIDAPFLFDGGRPIQKQEYLFLGFGYP